MPVLARAILPAAALPRKFRFAFAADFHIRKSTPDRYVREVCALVCDAKADLLLLGGDYGESVSAARRLFDEINRYSFPCGACAVVGNNDRECFRDLKKLRAIMHLPLLVNESIRIRAGGRTIEIGGVDEMKHGAPDAHSLFSDAADYRILLSHYPVVPDFGSGTKADLILSGHTHGGQMNLFGFTSYSLGFEKNRAAHLAGLREYHGIKLFVTTGIGASKLPLRLGAAPRVHLFEVVNQPS